MAKIFISFLGTGVGDPDSSTPGYNEVIYKFEDGTFSEKTRFAQRAIIEKQQPESFDRICLLMTEQSKKRHRQLLINELVAIGCDEQVQIQEDDSITTNQNAEQQWEWFDALQRLINDGDQVIFDFTHGFRSVPIIFSTAISFLQKVKRFELLHAYYGYVDQKSNRNEIIDMAKFYRINEWADGVSRLVDTADASKLAELAEEGKEDGFASLNDPQLVEALNTLTALIRNIDVKNIAKQADKALSLIQQKRQQCSGADSQLLNMVIDKFKDLASNSKKDYNSDYFELQLTLVEMLLKHELYMQAFTVMRECLGSLVHINTEQFLKSLNNNDKQKARYILSDLFLETIRKAPQKIVIKNNQFKYDAFINYVEPFYNLLAQVNSKLIPTLRTLEKALGDIRNGFNHAWVSKDRVPADLDKQGQGFLQELRDVITLLQTQKILK